MSRRILILVVAAALLAGACSDDTRDAVADETEPDVTASSTPSTTSTTTTTTSTTTSTTTTVPERLSGCGGADAIEAGNETLTLDTIDGRERTYVRQTPASYTSTEPVPLILNFHGFGSNALEQVFLSRLHPLSESEGFIVVTPEGTVSITEGEQFWNTGFLGDEETVDDVAFVNELLDQVEADLCIDTDRIFATGMSNGGHFSSLLGCVLADRIAAFASVTWILHTDDCNQGRTVSAMHFHGTDDQTVEFASIPGVVAAWATDHECAGEPEITAISDEVELREYVDCNDDGEIDFYVVDGGGHTWPGTALPPRSKPYSATRPSMWTRPHLPGSSSSATR